MPESYRPHQPRLEGRIAIVTGAGRGIGRAVASTLAARGYRAMAVSRTLAELRTLAEETGVEYLAESVATSEGCERIIKETRSRLGPIDVLINNAGLLSAAERAVWDESPSVWHEIFATNLHGPFEVIRRAAREMVERRSGRIVIVSAIAQRRLNSRAMRIQRDSAGISLWRSSVEGIRRHRDQQHPLPSFLPERRRAL